MSDSAPLKDKGKSRLLFIDVARSLAIAMVLLIHYFSTFEMHLSGYIGYLVTALLESGPPTFILLFGTMLELVYLKTLRKIGAEKTKRKLILRSFQCYLCYLFSATSCFFLYKIDFEGWVYCALFLGREPCYSNVLKFFTVALLLAYPLLRLRDKYGLNPLFLTGLSVWIVGPFLNLFPWPEAGSRMSHVTSFLVGEPHGVEFFNLLWGYALISLGMVVGFALQQDQEATSKNKKNAFLSTIMLIFLGLSTVAIALILAMGWRSFAEGFLFGKFRREHHIGYYSISLGISIAILWVLYRFLPPKTPYSSYWKVPLVLGRSSLLAFSFGNVGIVVLGELNTHLFPTFSLSSIPFAFGYLIFLAYFLYGIELIWKKTLASITLSKNALGQDVIQK